MTVGKRATILWCMTLLLGTWSPLMAQAPSISSVTPMGVAPGSTADVTLRGANLDGASQLWTSFSGSATLAPGVQGNGTKKSEVVFRVTVSERASVGVYGLRVATARGISPLRLIAVDDLPAIDSIGTNSTPSSAQELTPPTAVDGTITSLTRQYFKFSAEAGETLSFEVLARRLGSALDPMIRILNEAGRELTYSDDELGLRSDARLCHTFQEAGEYTLELRDIRYQGGGNHFFRLRVGDFPCVSTPYPMAVEPGSQTRVYFAGTHVDDVPGTDVLAADNAAGTWIHLGAKRKNGHSSSFAVLRVGKDREVRETEPNDSTEQPNRVQLGVSLNGRLAQPDDVDRFVFTAEKGDAYEFTAITRRQGSPTSLDMRLLKPGGGQVAAAQDFGVTDTALNYTFPADGDYTFVVKDLHGRGGNAFTYRVAVRPSRAGFSLTAADEQINVPAGGTATVTVNAQRHGYNGPIAVAAVNLPDEIRSNPTVIGPGQKSVVLTVTSAADAPPGEVFATHIVGTAHVGDRDVREAASTSSVLSNQFNALPWPPVALSESVALGVAPSPAFTLQVEPQDVVFGRDLKATVQVTARRQAEFDEEIALAVTPEKGGLPDGVSAATEPVSEAEPEAQVTFSANGKAPLGEFTAVLTGTLKHGKQTVTQAAPGITLKLEAPFRIEVEEGDGSLARGGELKIKVRVIRNPAFSGPVDLTVQKLPEGISTEKATLPKDESETELVLSASADAQQGNSTDVTVQGEAAAGKAKLQASSSPIALTVE